MEKELNIAAILKDKPNTKVWSDTFGELTFEYIDNQSKFPICLTAKNGNSIDLTKDGRYYCDIDGILPCIVPSRNMRDWEKFAWKKGDVLTDEERFVVFKGFNTDDYTEFSAPFEYEDDAFRQDLWFVTNDFRKASDNIAQEVIKKIEEHYGGKLNLETLQIEQPKPEFKDGDIVFAKCEEENKADYIVICKKITNYRIYDYCSLNIDTNSLDYTGVYCLDLEFYSLRLATDSEKQQLFDALAKEGKVWNSKTKQIEDLPKKCEFKVMDWYLMRDNLTNWTLCQFSHFEYFGEAKNIRKVIAVGGMMFGKCIPYNDSTKHLLGTTDEWKGGEL